jgi:hypothetical protein
MSTDLPDVISRYFERDTERDIDSIGSLFAKDATVIDEGEERRGTAELPAWADRRSLEIHLHDRDHPAPKHSAHVDEVTLRCFSSSRPSLMVRAISCESSRYQLPFSNRIAG